MSKLDRPEQQSEANVCLKVVWLAYDDVDAALLRHNLHNAILQAEHRVRLDCREVDGVPNELIDILHEANEFAKCSGKQITLATASDHLRRALLQNDGRFAPTKAANRGVGAISAAMAAENSLKHTTNSKHNSFKPTPMEIALPFQNLPGSRLAKLRRWLRRRATALVAIILGSAVVVGVEWYLLPFEAESFVIDQMGDSVDQPIHRFEEGAEPEP